MVGRERKSMDGKSADAVIRVECFLKRHAPKDIGAFTLNIHSEVDEKEMWHTRGIDRKRHSEA